MDMAFFSSDYSIIVSISKGNSDLHPLYLPVYNDFGRELRRQITLVSVGVSFNGKPNGFSLVQS